jgi:ferredoxin
MNIKKAYAIFFSPTGTTQKAVIAFAKGTDVPLEKIDLTTTKSRQAFSHSFGKDELVIIGLPVYGGRLPKNIEDFFSGLRGNKTPAVALVMYGNREYDDALIELKIRLEEQGFIVKAGAAFIGEHTFSKKIAAGRPDANDLASARSFGKQTLECIGKNISGTLIVKGNYPFTAKGFDHTNPRSVAAYANIITLDRCMQCGLCAENCPWEAIAMDDFKTIDSAKCMRCFRCLKNCPACAKVVKDEKFLELLPQFEARLSSQRREPELFLPNS